MPNPVNPIGPVVLPHHNVAIKEIQDKIELKLTADYKARLNVAVLPDNIAGAIRSASQVAAQRASRANFEAEAFRAAKTFFQPTDVKTLIGNKLKQAKDGVALVAASADLAAILAENASMLAKKRKALEDTGAFSKEEAFQMILAEIEGKAARRGNS